jgi:hypothetical protein
MLFSQIKRYSVTAALTAPAAPTAPTGKHIDKSIDKLVVVSDFVKIMKYDMFGRIQNLKPCNKCGKMKY